MANFGKIFGKVVLKTAKTLIITNWQRQDILKGKRPLFRLTFVTQKSLCLTAKQLNRSVKEIISFRLIAGSQGNQQAITLVKHL